MQIWHIALHDILAITMFNMCQLFCRDDIVSGKVHLWSPTGYTPFRSDEFPILIHINDFVAFYFGDYCYVV